VKRVASTEVVRKFVKRVENSVRYHAEMLHVVQNQKHQATLETMLAEQFVLNTAVLWEVFLSDVLVAHLATAPQTYLTSLKARVVQSLRDKFGSETARHAAVKLPRAVSLEQARKLVDPKSFNVTVKSATDLVTRANDLLAAPHAKKFSLGGDDRDFLDYIIALRNFLGHRSTASRDRLREAVNKLVGTNKDLGGSVREIGAYLKTKKTGGDTRAVLIARRLIDLARTLA
jgi:hypothetical protein